MTAWQLPDHHSAQVAKLNLKDKIQSEKISISDDFLDSFGLNFEDEGAIRRQKQAQEDKCSLKMFNT